MQVQRNWVWQQQVHMGSSASAAARSSSGANQNRKTLSAAATKAACATAVLTSSRANGSNSSTHTHSSSSSGNNNMGSTSCGYICSGSKAAKASQQQRPKVFNRITAAVGVPTSVYVVAPPQPGVCVRLRAACAAVALRTASSILNMSLICCCRCVSVYHLTCPFCMCAAAVLQSTLMLCKRQQLLGRPALSITDTLLLLCTCCLSCRAS